MKQIVLWLRIIRPQTLFASLCPVLVGLMVAQTHIPQSSSTMKVTALLTVLCALALQILSNLINDYYDYKRGTDKQGRVGFKRALAEGLVSEREMLTACLVTLSIALILGAVLCYIGGWVIVVIGITAILFAWLYTATPYSLSYLGIADIFVFLYYGVIATWGTVWLQFQSAEQPSTSAFLHLSMQEQYADLSRCVCWPSTTFAMWMTTAWLASAPFPSGWGRRGHLYS